MPRAMCIKSEKKMHEFFLEKVKWTNVFSVSSTSCVHWPHTVGLNLGGHQGASPRVEMSTLIRVFAREKCDSWIQIWWVHRFFGEPRVCPRNLTLDGGPARQRAVLRGFRYGVCPHEFKGGCAPAIRPFPNYFRHLLGRIACSVHTRHAVKRLAFRASCVCVRRYNMSNYGRRAFCFAGPYVWNSLPEHIRQ